MTGTPGQHGRWAELFGRRYRGTSTVLASDALMRDTPDPAVARTTFEVFAALAMVGVLGAVRVASRARG